MILITKEERDALAAKYKDKIPFAVTSRDKKSMRKKIYMPENNRWLQEVAKMRGVTVRNLTQT